MALVKPDYKLKRANSLFKFMNGEITELPRSMCDITQEERDELLLYLIKEQRKVINKKDKKIEEFQGVFNAIGKFIPRSSRSF